MSVTEDNGIGYDTKKIDFYSIDYLTGQGVLKNGIKILTILNYFVLIAIEYILGKNEVLVFEPKYFAIAQRRINQATENLL